MFSRLGPLPVRTVIARLVVDNQPLGRSYISGKPAPAARSATTKRTTSTGVPIASTTSVQKTDRLRFTTSG